MTVFVVYICQQEEDGIVHESKKLPGPPIKRRKSNPSVSDSQFAEALKQTGAALETLAKNKSEKSTPAATEKAKDHFDVIGSYVASKLRSMDPEDATRAENRIMTVLIEQHK